MSAEAPIAALATHAGESETAFVRVSGAGCHALVAKIFEAEEPHREGALPEVRARVERGRLSIDAETAPLLPALCVWYPAGRSYTGEESVELAIPGAVIWPRAVLAALERHGVSAAGPGEFTRRAFENGRIDLTRAESVATLIAAESLDAARAARRTLDGALADAVRSVADQIHDTIALLEAGLDFADQEIDPPSPATIIAALAPVRAALEEWLERPDAGGAVGENARLLLWGQTNAGKSSLLNALCQEDHALVSDLEGTTTDAVAGRLELERGTVEILDLPGRKGELTSIEARADDLARGAIAEEDPIAYLFDSSRPVPELVAERESLAADLRARSIWILHKVDRLSPRALDEWRERWPEALHVSSRTGAGLDDLRGRLSKLLAAGEFASRGASLHFNDRQRRRVAESRETLRLLVEDLGQVERTEPELVVVDLRRAHESLEEITGEIVTEETLTRIFSRFCVGK